MLQNLANKPSYSKEQYMMTLNPFVENNKARINQFLNNLCDIGDFFDTLEVWIPLRVCIVSDRC
jgi:Ras GTPase-activating-like protein IQGAP2/3